MIEIINNLHVGSDEDVPEALKKGMAVASMCKEGPHGHRSVLGYTSHAAPKDKNYYFYEQAKHLYVNLVDSDDPNFIPDKAINPALEFIAKHMASGDRVLVHCNQGQSRGPVTALMYLRSIGEMPHPFVVSERVMRTLYPNYSPASGVRQYARSHWSELSPKGE